MTEALLTADDRVHVQVLILHHLWTRGASSLRRVAETLNLSVDMAESCIDELTSRRFAYELWPSPEGKLYSVYFLTGWFSRMLREEFNDSSRYKMEVLWLALQREQGGLPSLPPSLAQSII